MPEIMRGGESKNQLGHIMGQKVSLLGDVGSFRAGAGGQQLEEGLSALAEG